MLLKTITRTLPKQLRVIWNRYNQKDSKDILNIKKFIYTISLIWIHMFADRLVFLAPRDFSS
jgi:hypothetical protein